MRIIKMNYNLTIVSTKTAKENGREDENRGRQKRVQDKDEEKKNI